MGLFGIAITVGVGIVLLIIIIAVVVYVRSGSGNRIPINSVGMPPASTPPASTPSNIAPPPPANSSIIYTPPPPTVPNASSFNFVPTTQIQPASGSTSTSSDLYSMLQQQSAILPSTTQNTTKTILSSPPILPLDNTSRPTTIADCGYSSRTRGWYNMNNPSSTTKNDYCRWVGSPAYFACITAADKTNTYAVPAVGNMLEMMPHYALLPGDYCLGK